MIAVVASYGWWSLLDWRLILAAVYLAAGTTALGYRLGRTTRHETAAGVELTPPADGAEVAAAPVGTGSAGGAAGPDRTAPAPGAPAEGAGAPGVTPWLADPVDRAHAEMASVLLSPDTTLPAEVERTLHAAIDCLAYAQLAGDGVPCHWDAQARFVLADCLTPADAIEVLIRYLMPQARSRAVELLAEVVDVASLGGGRC